MQQPPCLRQWRKGRPRMSEERESGQGAEAPPVAGEGRALGQGALPGSAEMTALLSSTSKRVREVLETTERAAEAILEDAREEAQRQVDEARQRADALARERVDKIASLTEDLLAHAERAHSQAETLGKALAAATSELAGQLEHEYGPAVERGEQPEGAGPTTNGAAAPAPDAGKPAEGERVRLGRFARRRRRRALAGGSEEAVRVMAMQMSSAGMSREQITERLSSLFESEQAGSALAWLEREGALR